MADVLLKRAHGTDCGNRAGRLASDLAMELGGGFELWRRQGEASPKYSEHKVWAVLVAKSQLP